MIEKLPEDGFKYFKEVVKESKEGIHFHEFNKKLRDKFNLAQEVKKLLYTQMDDKFI